MIKKLLLITLIFLLSCKEKQLPVEEKVNTFYQPAITPDDIETITPKEAKTYHQDKTHKYEYRTGTSGSYEYNYDVIGHNQDSTKVSGNVNVSGKYGAGKIIDPNDNEIEVEVEWVGYGKLKGVDKNGNIYQLHPM